MKVYAVKDVLVGAFMQPVCMPNDEVALRSLKIAANDPNAFKENKKDIQLWYLYEFDEKTGIVSKNEPECLGNLIDFVENRGE